MLWFLYNILFAVGYFLMMPKFIVRMCKRGGYRKNFLQRLAVYSDDIQNKLNARQRIWVHAVSVGEVYVAVRFMREIRKTDAEVAFVFTTTTSTGYSIAERELSSEDVLLYFPSDFPIIIKRALNKIKPRAVLLTESEFWPNLLLELKKRQVPVILINGRMSESSCRGYRMVKVFFERAVEAVSLFLVQSTVDSQRFAALGAAPSRIHVVGSAKYDVAERNEKDERKTQELLRSIGIDEERIVLIGGSTWPGEEEILLNIFERLSSSFLHLTLILVPRHAERRKEIESLMQKKKLKYVLRTQIEQHESLDDARILLVDTTGELKSFYSCATLIFVGKSLGNHGGQNIIEPAMYGKPIIVGPNMENFPDVLDDFLTASGIVQVSDHVDLDRQIRRLLADELVRNEYGRQAAVVVQEKRGSVAKSTELIFKVLNDSEQHKTTTQ